MPTYPLPLPLPPPLPNAGPTKFGLFWKLELQAGQILGLFTSWLLLNWKGLLHLILPGPEALGGPTIMIPGRRGDEGLKFGPIWRPWNGWRRGVDGVLKL